MNFIVALQDEAKPIISQLGLKERIPRLPFSHFFQPEAFGYNIGNWKNRYRFCDRFSSWEIGCGKKTANLYKHRNCWSRFSQHWYSIFIANRISNEEKTVTYYPPQIINSGMTSSSLLTCNKPSED